MMHAQTAYTLVNQQNGNLAFKLFSFDDTVQFDHVQRLNYFTLLWITDGQGKLKADFAEYDFSSNAVLAFAPYQPFMLYQTKALKGIAIQFHSDFFASTNITKKFPAME